MTDNRVKIGKLAWVAVLVLGAVLAFLFEKVMGEGLQSPTPIMWLFQVAFGLFFSYIIVGSVLVIIDYHRHRQIKNGPWKEQKR